MAHPCPTTGEFEIRCNSECNTTSGWRKLMPRPFHPKRDLAAQNAFKKTTFLML
jgi:hypothetical protein